MDPPDINAWASGIIAAIISSTALFVSVYTWKKGNERQDYTDLDTMYQNLLTVAVQDPSVRNEKEIEKFLQMGQDKDKRVKYDTYAYMAFNFCESVFDYARDEQNSSNKEAWLPAVLTEIYLHWKWFFEPENLGKFDNETRNDILKTIASQIDTFDSAFQKSFATYVTDKILKNVKLEERKDLSAFINLLGQYVDKGPQGLSR